MEKYKNKYRISSHRKPNWDYSADALYFLTIVTQKRECNLGKIVDTNENNVETHGNNVETHGNNAETHGNNAETHGRGFLRKSPSHEMILSDFGKIVEFEWFKSFEIRKELILHEFILMPNHLHTIVEIYNENWFETNVGTLNVETSNVVETQGRVSLPQSTIDLNNEILKIKQNPPIRLPKSISSFIAGFKSSVNTQIDNLIDEQNLHLPKFN